MNSYLKNSNFIYASLMIGLLCSVSCDCEKQYINCTPIVEDYPSRWLTAIKHNRLTFVNIKDSSDTISFMLDSSKREFTEIVACWEAEYNSCVCGECTGYIYRNVIDSAGKKAGVVGVVVYGNNDGGSGRYHLRLEWKNQLFKLNLPRANTSDYNYDYFDNVTLNTIQYENMYRFFNSKRVDGSTVEVPGYLFYHRELGVIQFEDPESHKEYTRVL